MNLHELLKIKIKDWRRKSYRCSYPVISEIFDFAFINSKDEDKRSRYLRKAQFEALEIYWYLRLIEKTPHIFNLYKKYLRDETELLRILGVPTENEEILKIALKGGAKGIIKKIKTDDNFVKKYRLEATRESLLLDYPSYILALAMGAGKTVLIGSIIATEFAMALEYPDAPFVKNALVFAPGKTILGALKEISDVPYAKILPPRLYKQFIATVKITYTRDGEKDIPIIKGSNFNVIVTNTEKIRLQKQSIPKSLLQIPFKNKLKEDEAKELVARQRLQTITSMPNLALFADEGDVLFGQQLGKELKRVRTTVDYINQHTNVLVVVNTTGTPYYKRQILKDVVYWYGLSQGIEDGILKEVQGNIVSYEDVSDRHLLEDIASDFFKTYKNVKTYDGNSAKLAIYFPKIANLREARPIIEKSLIKQYLDPSIILEVHNESPEETKALFDNRINEKKLPYRIFLLVNKGTRGWNCPSLFATALVRKLTSSNNFVLQAASRCLRQTKGNKEKAKIYLSKYNVPILDSQLKETYGESLEELNKTEQNLTTEKITLQKLKIPPVVLRKKVKKIIPSKIKIDTKNIRIEKPKVKEDSLNKIFYTPEEFKKRGVLVVVDQEKIKITPDFVDTYSLAVNLTNTYHLSLMPIYEKLKRIYPDAEIPEAEAINIQEQIEKQTQYYKTVIEEIEQALALIKKEGFEEEKQGDKTIYVTEITFNKSKAKRLRLLWDYKNAKKQFHQKQLHFGFHYSPYKFDSGPEREFFENILRELNQKPDDVEDIYFTGAIDDPEKTDFLFEYKDKKGDWHNYTPDFLIRKKNGKMLIVEIKGKPFVDKQKEKEMKKVEKLNPERLKYEILEINKENLGFNEVKKVKRWIYG